MVWQLSVVANVYRFPKRLPEKLRAIREGTQLNEIQLRLYLRFGRLRQ